MTSTGGLDATSPDVFSKLAAERPRLMATKSAIARTKTVVQHNAIAQRWQGEIAKQADLILALPPLTPAWKHIPAETGAAPLPSVRPPQSLDGAATPLDVARLFCLRIQTLGLVWLLTKPVRLAVLLSPDGDACATPVLPLALRRPLSDWVQSGRVRRRHC
jgi:hypothetical protein